MIGLYNISSDHVNLNPSSDKIFASIFYTGFNRIIRPVNENNDEIISYNLEEVKLDDPVLGITDTANNKELVSEFDRNIDRLEKCFYPFFEMSLKIANFTKHSIFVSYLDNSIITIPSHIPIPNNFGGVDYIDGKCKDKIIIYGKNEIKFNEPKNTFMTDPVDNYLSRESKSAIDNARKYFTDTPSDVISVIIDAKDLEEDKVIFNEELNIFISRNKRCLEFAVAEITNKPINFRDINVKEVNPQTIKNKLSKLFNKLSISNTFYINDLENRIPGILYTYVDGNIVPIYKFQDKNIPQGVYYVERGELSSKTINVHVFDIVKFADIIKKKCVILSTPKKVWIFGTSEKAVELFLQSNGERPINNFQTDRLETSAEISILKKKLEEKKERIEKYKITISRLHEENRSLKTKYTSLESLITQIEKNRESEYKLNTAISNNKSSNVANTIKVVGSIVGLGFVILKVFDKI